MSELRESGPASRSPNGSWREEIGLKVFGPANKLPTRGGQEATGRAWRLRFGWLTALSVVAVVALNTAGILGIAVARQGAMEDGARVLRLETSARARLLESILSATRADLFFLTGSPAFSGLESALASSDPREVRWHRLGAEGALLLFLRGHPAVKHLVVRSAAGAALVEAGRRGGVPVLWVSRTQGAGTAGTPGTRTGPDRITAVFTYGGPLPGSDLEAVHLEAEMDPAVLLAQGRVVGGPAREWDLRDGAGRRLAAEMEGAGDRKVPDPVEGVSASALGPPARPESLFAGAEVHVEGWSAPSPWLLTCHQSHGAGMALFEPLASRYRTMLALNLAVMGLAILLGSFAIQQARRRERLEVEAREEARVRELERQLFHAERLGTVGRLAAGIAHEINNPLEGMSNYLSLAREDLARGDVASAQRRMEGIGGGLQRAAGVVRQVLAHADPERAARTPVDLRPVLAQAMEFVRSREEFRGIEFGLELSDGPLVVRGSDVALGQVVLNLVLNACEAQPGGGEVRVTARREGDGVLIEVADRGPGVPPGEVERIFEPFYSTKRSTGLGLSVCHSIVRQHDGELSVDERKGGGAAFRIRLAACGDDERVLRDA